MIMFIDPRVFLISRIILFFVATWFVYTALQAMDFSRVFKQNSTNQIRFILMVVSVILGYLFVDAFISLFEMVNELI
jgi:uncharacterized membrane protein YwzB